MERNETLLAKLEENRNEMVQALRGLLAIPSAAAPAKGEWPFGEGVHRAFAYMLDLASQEGFEVENTDNYGGHIQLDGILPGNAKGAALPATETMGIVGHLDVVPEGSGWTHPPFAGEIKDGRLYGRGAIDNKGPVMSAFFAMKALKDCGIVPKKNIRLILGLDEETGWLGMKHYLSKVKAPDFGFTPDAEFPVIHAEKGVIVFDLARKFGRTHSGGLELRRLAGGEAPNMVAADARAVVLSPDKNVYGEIKAKAAEFRGRNKAQIRVKAIGKSLEIVTTGVSAHGARPESGVNAISAMMDFLGGLSFGNEDVNDFIDFYNRHIGYELDGQSLGCALSDGPSGNLVLNVGMVEMDGKAARLTINVRYPVTLTDSHVYDAILPAVHKYGLGIVKGLHHKPLYTPLDDPFLVTLMEVYREHTGDTQSQPLVIGGGTYARAMDHCVAFGASFPGEREVAHQKDEFIELDKLMMMTRIYADAIWRLAC